MSTHQSSSFDLLHKDVQRWLWDQGWSSLRDIQENSIPIVLRGDCDVIITAATAGGKTEAAFLPILTSILQQPNTMGYEVLYISPLKSLINDQYRRLLDMTAKVNIDVTPWHGDIDSKRKQKSLNIPKGVVIITPESLESLFVNHNEQLPLALSSLKYIVIDEMHAFIGTERGKQLQSLISRVEFLVKRAIPRIAMSATLSDYDVAKQFLRTNDVLPCIVPPQGDSNHEVKVLVKEYLPSEHCDSFELISREIYSKLRGSNNLVFAGNKEAVELYTLELADLCNNNGVPNEFRTHHGSLSKVERETVEHELQRGEQPITAICTTTMELGVDIGKVKSIVQIGKVASVSGLRQRLGRSGRRGEPSILRVFSVEKPTDELSYDLRANLVQSIAAIELLKEKRYENYDVNRYHFSTLIHQILSALAQYGSFYAKDGWSLLCEKGAFQNITPAIFIDILKSLSEKKIISQLQNGQIVIGVNGEKIIRQSDFYVVFNTPDEYTVIDKNSAKRLGVIERIVEVGTPIIIAGRRWIVDSISDGASTLYVIPYTSKGKIAFKRTYMDVDRVITKRMLEIYRSKDIYPYLDQSTNTNEELQVARSSFRALGLDRNNFLKYVDQTIFATWAGGKINHTIKFIAKQYLYKDVSCSEIFIEGITKSDISKIIIQGKPSGEKLASMLPRKNKYSQKYDHLLSDKLLDIEYSSSALDIDGAWELITNQLQ